MGKVQVGLLAQGLQGLRPCGTGTVLSASVSADEKTAELVLLVPSGHATHCFMEDVPPSRFTAGPDLQNAFPLTILVNPLPNMDMPIYVPPLCKKLLKYQSKTVRLFVPDFRFVTTTIPVGQHGWRHGNVVMVPATHQQGVQNCYMVGFSTPLSDLRLAQSYPPEIYPIDVTQEAITRAAPAGKLGAHGRTCDDEVLSMPKDKACAVVHRIPTANGFSSAAVVPEEFVPALVNGGGENGLFSLLLGRFIGWSGVAFRMPEVEPPPPPAAAAVDTSAKKEAQEEEEGEAPDWKRQRCEYDKCRERWQQSLHLEYNVNYAFPVDSAMFVKAYAKHVIPRLAKTGLLVESVQVALLDYLMNHRKDLLALQRGKWAA